MLSEMCLYFLETLGSPYVKSMVGAVYRDFADLIAAKERIEILPKAGKLLVEQADNNQAKKAPYQRRKSQMLIKFKVIKLSHHNTHH